MLKFVFFIFGQYISKFPLKKSILSQLISSSNLTLISLLDFPFVLKNVVILLLIDFTGLYISSASKNKEIGAPSPILLIFLLNCLPTF